MHSDSTFPALRSPRSRLVLGSVLALSVALFAACVAGTVRGYLTPSFPVASRFGPGPMVITDVLDDGPGDPGEVRVGDIVRAVNGTRTDDYQHAVLLIRERPRGSSVSLTLERDGRELTTTIRSDDELRPVTVALALHWVFLLASWGVIVLIFWKRAGDLVAIFTALAGGVVLAVLGIENPIYGVGGITSMLAWCVLFMVLLTFEGVLFLHWSMRHPVRVTTQRWLLPAAYASSLTASVIAFTVLIRVFPERRFNLLFTGMKVQFAVNIILSLAAIWILARTYHFALSAERRLQVKWVILGLCVGILPYVLFSLLPAFFNSPPLLPPVCFEIAYLAVPLGFLASILRYRLFDVELLAGRSMLVGFILLAVILVHVALRPVLSPLVSHAAGQWATSILLVGIPAYLFRRRLYSPLGMAGLRPQALHENIWALSRQGGSPESLSRRVLEQIVEGLQLERALVFLVDSSQRRFVCSHAVGFRLLSRADLRFPAEGPFAEWLGSHVAPVRTRTYDRPLGLGLLPQRDRELIERLDAVALVPLEHGHRVLGFLAIGPHRSGRLPNSAMLAFVARLAQEIARTVQVALSERETQDDTGGFTIEPWRPSTGASSQPERTGPYRLLESVGSGSFGEVWRAVHEPTGRVVAVKLLHRSPSDPRVFRRFLGEIAALTGIHSPHVIAILDYGNDEGIPWFAMEYSAGENLAQRLERLGVLDTMEALRIAGAVAEGLAACHGVGIIHRDVKPANVLLPGKKVLLADLGLAHRVEPRLGLIARSKTAAAGTLLYMAPEQVEGARLSFATDLFSLGIVLYECLTGRHPFRGQSPNETLDKIKRAEFEPADRVRPGLAPDVVNLVNRLLVREPDRRAQPARWVSRELARCRRVAGATAERRIA